MKLEHGRVRVVVATALWMLALAGPARAQIDASGPWSLHFAPADVPFAGGGTVVVVFTQAGVSLIVRGSGFHMDGSIDPMTGVFSVSDGGQCPSELGGTVNATATFLQGSGFFNAPHGSQCYGFSEAMDGQRCGNGVVDPGEVCDDGNRDDGDCCSADCQTIVAGATCDDGNPCTTESCSAAGTCDVVVLPDGSACDDGEFCNGTDSCVDGRCFGHSGNPCGPDKPECARTCNYATESCADFAFVACTDDGNACTDDHCDGAGACIHPAVPANPPCSDDGQACTSDFCAAGSCVHPLLPQGTLCGPVAGPCDVPSVCSGTDGVCPGGPLPAGTRGDCPACEKCDGNGACVEGPQSAPACVGPAQPGGSTLDLHQGASDPKDTVKWTWRGAATLADYGSPELTDDYALCVYTLAGSPAELLGADAPAAGACGTHSCWSRTSRHLTYRDPFLTPDGILSIVLQPGRMTLRGKGAGLAMPGLPLPLPLLVQLQARNGSCWEAHYGGAKRNDAGRLKAASD